MFTRSIATLTGLRSSNAACATAALCLFILFLVVSTAAHADKLAPGMPYYFDHFNPDQRPWEPGQHLNIEEVFKNYQYYEIVAGQNGNEITVNLYIRGSKASSKKYLVLPDGSLQRNE